MRGAVLSTPRRDHLEMQSFQAFGLTRRCEHSCADGCVLLIGSGLARREVRRRKVVPEVGIEPTRGVNPTGF